MVARVPTIISTCEEIGTRERQRISLPTELTHKPSQKSHVTLRLMYHLPGFNHTAMLSCKGAWKNIIYVGHKTDLNKITLRGK